MIEISKLNKYYKIGNDKMHALKDITLNIQNGEMLAIMGKSGAGKSTLMNMIGLLDKYDSGNLKIDGIEVSMLGDSKLAKLRNEKIGFVMQDFSLLEQKTVLMNVMLPLYFNNKYNFSNMKKIAMEILQRVGIAEQANKKANQLSGGQKQRVAIARAIANSPDVILADEPTNDLDGNNTAIVLEAFSEIAKSGTVVIMITHDNHISSYGSRIMTMKNGKLV